jgi:tRNA-Thr(GGU) m(6)t(6)A37 methyltransferase TsaA
MQTFELRSIGAVESSLVDPADAPRQAEGAPEAWLVIDEAYAEAMRDVRVGQELVLLTWLYRAARDVLSTYRGHDPAAPVLGVFSLRSPNRPNPIGVHRVRIDEMDGTRLRVPHLEAVHGTPVLDLKPVLDEREG